MPSLLVRAIPWLAAAGLLIVAFLAIFNYIDVKSIFADRSMRPPAEACPRLDIGPRQCEGIVARALALTAVDPASVLGIDLGRPDGQRAEIGRLLVATARLHLTDGRSLDQEVWCIGVGGQNQAWCTEDPMLDLWMGADHDVPMGATPVAPDPEAVAAATPLRIAALDIPLALGDHRVELGRATLANGYLEEARFSLADPAPDGVVLLDGVNLVIEPVDPSRPPLGNVYERGLIPGVEPVIAYLVFDVVAAPAGAVLEVRDVVVR